MRRTGTLGNKYPGASPAVTKAKAPGTIAHSVIPKTTLPKTTLPNAPAAPTPPRTSFNRSAAANPNPTPKGKVAPTSLPGVTDRPAPKSSGPKTASLSIFETAAKNALRPNGRKKK
jgi:hypothetical protein